jgi:hypothetical protein
MRMEGSKSRVSCARHRRVLFSCLQANGSDVVQRVKEMVKTKSRIRGSLIVNNGASRMKAESSWVWVWPHLTHIAVAVAVVVDGLYPAERRVASRCVA